MVLYFFALSDSLCAAIDAPWSRARSRSEGANRWEHVKSHTRERPRDQGMRVTPSGRFPSVRESPVGSSWDGTSAEFKARRIMSLPRVWRAKRPHWNLQHRAWFPWASDSAPHTHVCERKTLAPSRRLTAMRNWSLVSLVPTFPEGMACSQSPAHGAEQPYKRARPSSLFEHASRFSNFFWEEMSVRTFCLRSEGQSRQWLESRQNVKASLKCMSKSIDK